MGEHFSLSDCDVIGFDLDHTLCRYRLQESSKLIYNSFAQYLVAEKGYKEDLLSVTSEEWDFCFKGLVLDLEEGNFLKLAADGTILRACHGTKTMTAEMIEEVYGEKREWKHFKAINGTYARSAKYYFYDNYFDLPGALLCAKIVDSLEMTDGQKKYDFWKDIISAIEHNYKTTAFKGKVVVLLRWIALDAFQENSQLCRQNLEKAKARRCWFVNSCCQTCSAQEKENHVHSIC